MTRTCQTGPRQAGFSLVEMLVALAFTLILMAGMATVFRGSLSTALKANEQMSNVRRNRMSLDMVYDDLNNMGLYLMNLTTYPTLPSTAPGFFVSPNVSYAGTGLVAQGTLPGNWVYPASTGDELYLYMDQPLPYDGQLSTGLSGLSSMESLGTALSDSNTYNITFPDATSAGMVQQGMYVVFRDAWDVKQITSAPTISNTSVVTVTTTGAVNAGGYDTAAGAPTGSTPLSKVAHSSGKSVLVVNPAQQVRYSIQARALDPSNASAKIPCLVREQGPYGSAFDQTQTVIIAENIIGFKAFVSADLGATWAGMGYTAAGTDGDVTAWNNTTTTGKFRHVLDTSLAATTSTGGTWGRAGFKDTSSNSWFREIPLVVRIDLLSRTNVQRTEYGNHSATTPTADYGTRLQTLILVPRHTGLPLG